MPEIVSRKEAKALGLKRFFTAIPCSRGHVCEGWVGGMSCIECFNIKNMESYFKNHEERKAHNRKYNRLHRKEARERWRKWKCANLEHARKKARLQAKKDRERNLAKHKKRDKFYYLNGPSNPKDAKQWLRKAQVVNRNLRRLIRKPNLDHSSWLRPDPGT